MPLPEALRERTAAGERLTRVEAEELLRTGELLELGRLADVARRERHGDGTVTYVIDRNINYTNVCRANCTFCAFYRRPGSDEAYTLSREQLAEKIEETLLLGGKQILLQGGLNPELGIEYYEELFRWIKDRYGIWIHGLSPPEVTHIARTSRLGIEEVLRRLVAAGLDSIPGGGAEILSDRVRKRIGISKGTTADWLAVMEGAHHLGLRTTATMMFGHVETLEERIEHLLLLRDLQDRTGGFTAFIPWTFQPAHTQLDVPEATSYQYLRLLAVARLVLDNVPNLQVSWVTQGPKIGQVALLFGANDFGSVMIEENVVSAAGAHFRMTEREMVRLIRDAGFVPRRRNMHYEILGDPLCDAGPDARPS